MMTVSSAQAINPALYKNPGFDPVRDFAPISLIGAVPNALGSHYMAVRRLRQCWSTDFHLGLGGATLAINQ